MAESRTKPEQIDALVAIFQARLSKASAATVAMVPPANSQIAALVARFRQDLDDPAHAQSHDAKNMMNAVPLPSPAPGAAGVATGSCSYKAGNTTFCISNVSQDECTQLGGDFSNGPCDPLLSPWDTL
jgi:hypothetical protein